MEQTLEGLCERFGALGINTNMNHDGDREFVRVGARGLLINKVILANLYRQPDYMGVQEDYDD